MIGYQVLPADVTVLPAAMLDLAKQHMRVEFTTDDAYIQNCLARAINIFERISGWRLNPTTAEWWPVITASDIYYRCPVQPVSDFLVSSGGTDISAGYHLRYESEEAPYYLVNSAQEPWPDDAAVTLTVGYSDPDTMPVAALDSVLRIAATLYERRETVDAGSLDLLPDWMNELITGIWIPRC